MRRLRVDSKTMRTRVLVALIAGLVGAGVAVAEEKKTYKLDDVVVSGRSGEVLYTPQSTTIDVNSYEKVGTPQNVGDIIADQPIIDFRGASDLVPGDVVNGDDTLWMRGFSSNRFVTAIDGANIHKPGGHNTFHVVDYSLLPTFLVDEIEILPGPHSALFPGQSIGGVINLKSDIPERADSAKPELSVSSDYRSYDTHNHSLNVRGGVGDFVYAVGYQNYSTDGYLRHSAAEIDTGFGRIGYILPSGGHIALTVAHSQAEREIPVRNDPRRTDYEGSYPVVEQDKCSYSASHAPEWDESATAWRLNVRQPTPIGTWELNTWYSEETWEKTVMNAGVDTGWEVTWYQQGGKLQDTITFSDKHETIIGADLQQFFDTDDDKQEAVLDEFDKKKRVELAAGFVQHRWQIIDRLTLTAGLRYEHAEVTTDNLRPNGSLYIPSRSRWIDRSFDGWLPKSFLTYELDDVADSLRDTSVSLGVSRIWRAPINYGDINPRGTPAGAWTEPEHGIGYDLVVSRRLVNDIQVKINYAYYEIEDWLAWNWKYDKNDPDETPAEPVPAGMEYSDYVINLDKVTRHGLDVQVGGHITDDLSFYLGYAWQTFDSKGGELAGKDVVDDIAENRLNAGVRYRLPVGTVLMLDYKYQDEQVAKKSEKDAWGNWVFKEIPMDASHVFDLAAQHTFFSRWGALTDGTLKLYVKNLFDEKYQTLAGYPATDRTYGVALSVGL